MYDPHCKVGIFLFVQRKKYSCSPPMFLDFSSTYPFWALSAKPLIGTFLHYLHGVESLIKARAPWSSCSRESAIPMLHIENSFLHWRNERLRSSSSPAARSYLVHMKQVLFVSHRGTVMDIFFAHCSTQYHTCIFKKQIFSKTPMAEKMQAGTG
ncbi:uncharacterized protein LOC124704274 [Lolium rigidum]|uniref:uncharacterized protein LOC124704274 n=1 Tax=Lolium rigidum TaxID=89674 RepID=UPI001F5C8ABA|nr:uncharacterized protein LOC124704274 [Lolium rigidum]